MLKTQGSSNNQYAVVFEKKGTKKKSGKVGKKLRKGKRRWTAEKDIIWLPLGVGSTAAVPLPRIPGWKSVLVKDNVIDLKGFNKVSRLVIRNIYIHTIGTTLFIEGRAQA